MEKNSLYFSKAWLKSLAILLPITFILSFGIYKNIVDGNTKEVISIVVTMESLIRLRKC